MIPFVNRTCDIVLPNDLEAKDINVREVIDELRSQCDTFTDLFEAVVFMAPGRFRLTCKSARKLEVAERMGFLVRGCPVEFRPISTFKWVNITRLSYGIPEVEISRTLEPFGRIKLIKSEQYSNVYTGVRNVLMEVHRDIPARIRIAGHWCFIHYKGQKKLCFKCGKEGHMRGECPDRVVEVPVGAQLDTNVPDQGEIGASPPAGSDPPVVDPPAVLPSPTVEVVPLPAPAEEHIHVSDPSVPELEGESVVSVPVEMVPVEGIQQASIVGGKRRRSPTRQKSSSPRSKKDRRRDKSPWGECSVSASDPDESDASVSEDLSFDSDLALGVEPENVPLPVDDDTELDIDTTDSPLTQITPNLPGVLPGWPPIPVPEDSQASEETRVVTRFFATIGSNSQNQGDSMESA
jgi:hypothetical protein